MMMKGAKVQKTNIHPSNRVHQTAYIEEGAVIGHNNHFGPFTYISACVVIGDNCRFEGHCSIGSPPEHKGLHFAPGNHGVLIGNGVVVKEFVTINRGTTHTTTIQDGVWMLRGSHAGHDSLVMHDATISCNVVIGGHSVVMDKANIGLGAVIHQRRCIGSYAMIGMGAVVTKSMPPFMTAYGSPCKPKHLNFNGMLRGGAVTESRLSLFKLYEALAESQMGSYKRVMEVMPPEGKSIFELWTKLIRGTSDLSSVQPEEKDLPKPGDLRQ